jgi:hypothetical protein|tara:strand:- start:1251 stop:2198 length:948 start_codon:yes stop_codon:yes gene_type:complete
MDILVHDKNGKVINSIELNDTIEYVDGRVCKGSKSYYKGVGIPYKYHHIQPEQMSDEYNLIEKSDVFYIGNCVSKKVFSNKTGIFQEKYQSHFTDWIGACGIKELNILENLYDEGRFEMSAIEVFGYETIDKDNEQYYLSVDYPDGRINYVNDSNAVELRNLLDYMIQNDWNFPWDKDSISDINSKSKVTDVADLFKSNELKHKIGSVYSVLYSLHETDRNLYLDFCNVNKIPHYGQMSFVINTLTLLAYNKVDVRSLYDKTPAATYKNIVKNYIIPGKNCGFCGVGSCKRREDENLSYGEYIMREYSKKFSHDM